MTNEQLVAGGFGGVLWTIAYIMIIWRSYKDKTYGVPFVAICTNISWEFVFTFIFPPKSQAQWLFNLGWFVLDIFIVGSLLIYGKKEFKGRLPASLFYPTLIFILIISFFLVLTSVPEFKDYQGKYSAFFMDLVMSVLFIEMLIQRQDVRGQSFYIAIFKMTASMFYTMVFYLFDEGSMFLLTLYLLTFASNIIYSVLMYHACKRLNINPWQRI
jgi:hypothetical protein